MKRLFIVANGTLKRKSNTLALETKEGTKYVPITTVGSVYVFGEVRMNKRLLQFLSKNHVPVHFFGKHYLGSFYPRLFNASGFMVLKQVEAYMDPRRRGAIARKFVEGAIKNMATVLRENRLSDDALKLREYISMLTDDVDSTMGVEGNARSFYFSCLDKVLPQGFRLEKRTRRPPENMGNSLMSLMNTLLYTAVLDEVYQTHLDPRVGFLHSTNFRRFSLNLDVAEVFRPVIVDRLMISMTKRRELTEEDFEDMTAGLKLTQDGLKKVLSAVDKRLSSTVKVGKRKMSYSRVIRTELYKLERHLSGDVEYSPFLIR
ncbi:type I-B CRISPR-associated endonuclease Cas1b [Sulfuracidifex tepidarius]|uniref:CRISPR-associated endonuclease Cas1 n=1 Tax=Sulfuracidifex tepidarius TaxID=1294262 RepID=A0A510E0I3_9CREN|nr:type I-B CRISPR-associated endonuclease Cas1b [Sulfuracidifex tepidarius]BBG26013.1 CRISPR-associated endonuclease Cas1 [Sulfuracidifex tepidarius]